MIVALAIHAVIGLVMLVLGARPQGDFDRFWEIATTAGRPYVDFPVERAPGEVAALKIVAALTGQRALFGPALVLLNLAADAAIIAALSWGWGAAAAICFAIAVLPVLDVLYSRIDLWSTAAATLAIAAWRRDRREATAAAIALGGAFKLWPLAFAVLLVTPPRTHFRFRPLLVFAAAAAGLGALWLAHAGWSGLFQVMTFRGADGWQIESVVGSVIQLLTHAPARFDAGSYRIGVTSGAISIVMFTAAAPICAWSIWRAGRTGHLGAGWLACLSTLLLFSALFSLQFVGWLVPGAAIAWAENDRRPARLTVVAVLLTGVFWRFYGSIIDGVAPAVLVVVLRNAVIAAVAGSAFIALVTAPVLSRARTSPRVG